MPLQNEWIICDACPREAMPGLYDAADLRLWMHVHGWQDDGEGRYYCPGCAVSQKRVVSSAELAERKAKAEDVHTAAEHTAERRC
jgi:hypothetical protein